MCIDIENVTLPQGYPIHELPICVTRPMATFVYFTHTHGLILYQGYVPEKRSTNQTQNSHLKQCVSGLGD